MARKNKGMSEQLFEATKNRFQQILEYTVLNNNIMGEADDEAPQDGQEQTAPEDAGGMSPQDGGQPMSDAMGGGMPPQGGEAQSPMDAGPQQGQGGQSQQPEGFAPQEPQMAPDMTSVEDNEEQPAADDDVVDISALTDSQEATEKDVAELNNKFSEIMSKLDSFVDLIKSNDEKIEDIKAEYERRNPTQIEKMSMNTAKGGPFNVSPEEYWDEKEKNSNYRREDDDNGREQGQYVITANDVNGATDWKGISDSLDDDILMHQTLNNIMGIC